MPTVIGRVAVKHCPRCKTTKDTTEYNVSADRKDGLAGWCRECQKDSRLDKKRHYQSYEMQRRYGITLERFEVMLMEQGGACAICKEACSYRGRLSIDHDHETGEVRGLLCGRCNHAIGLLRDNPTFMQGAITYLTERG